MDGEVSMKDLRATSGFRKLGWIRQARITAYGWILTFASLMSLGPKWVQAMGSDGSDFQAFWSAAKLTVMRHPSSAYDPAAMQAMQSSIGRPEWFAFVNPPPFLLLTAPFGTLPYPIAWWAWVIVGWVVWLLVSRRLVPGFTSSIAGFPGALVAAWHAQTGLFISALQAGVAVLLDRRPFMAGICCGMLVMKPHLAILFPIALLADRQWRAIAGAAISVAGLLGLSWLVLGTATMSAYPSSWNVSRYLLETGSAEFYLRQCTVYASVRLLAGPVVAAVAQVLSSAIAILVTWKSWRKPWPLQAKLAVLLAATPLATPYLFSYDLPFLVLPTIWLAAQEQIDPEFGWRRPQLVIFYLSPLLTRAFALPLRVNLMPLISIWMLVAVVHRANLTAERSILSSR